jgi:hypothetical protein
MKQFLSKVLFTLIILSSVLILGLFIPIVISIFVSVFTDIAFSTCISSQIFWICSLLGCMFAIPYINQTFKEVEYGND